MGLGRRRVGLQQPERWVYNRMADAYQARPDYPEALISSLSELAGKESAQIVDVVDVVDIGAGIGHLSLPLAARGHRVSAVEPALAMLEVLRERSVAAGLPIDALHATAEALPLPDASVALAVIADALHFLDAHRAGHELARVLRADGALAVVLVDFGASPFMQALRELMQEAAPRRPRRVDAAMTQLATLAGIKLEPRATFESELALDFQRVEHILRSISFIGPAMNPERFAAFSTRLRAIPHPPVWHTTLQLWAGRR